MEAIKQQIHTYATLARQTSYQMLSYQAGQKSKALYAIADALLANKDKILAANAIDLDNARQAKLAAALIDRLELTEKRIDSMAAGVKQIADMTDPVGSVASLNTQARGFKLGKMRVPIGVVAIIYESRPNVTVDAAALCLKAGNAVILRGGKEAFASNSVLVELMQHALTTTEVSENAIQFVKTTDRVAVDYLLTATGLIDVVIPRGGKGLVQVISEKARVPVIKHLDGVCHVYIDEFADLAMAVDIAINAKTYRYGICGAMETLLVNSEIADKVLSDLAKQLIEKGVELVGCQRTQAILNDIDIVLATEADWVSEYLAAKLSIKVVDNIDEAIKHINHYGSHHTDSIVTNDIYRQNTFLNQVDSASVMVNVPTCFADGFEYGLGAEIGISTDKLHARGPVGVVGLTTEKYIVLGQGELRD